MSLFPQVFEEVQHVIEYAIELLQMYNREYADLLLDAGLLTQMAKNEGGYRK